MTTGGQNLFMKWFVENSFNVQMARIDNLIKSQNGLVQSWLPCLRSVKIWAVTVQNEPEHNAPWEACCYTAKDAWPWP